MKEGFYYGGEMIEELLKIKEELLGDIKKSTNLKELNEVRVSRRPSGLRKTMS